MSDPGHKLKKMWLHPEEDIMSEDKEARRHLAIIEIPLEDIVSSLGFSKDFIIKDAKIDDDLPRVRIKLQHPSFPIHKEAECIVVLPLIHKE